MSLAGSQQKVFLRLLAELRPHWRRDQNFPSRVSALFAANRSFGSRDRKLYRELIFTTLRFLPWIEPLLDTDPARATQAVAWLAADLPATRAFRAAHCGDWPASPPSVAGKAAQLGADATVLLPAWFTRHCPAAAQPPNLDALHTRASLWLRLSTRDADRVTAEFTSLGWATRRSEILSGALEVLAEADVTKTAAWRDGLVEVQDLGSQLILGQAGLAPGGRWLDACAGAGGKTLQLAALLGPSGHVDAYDIRPEALRELAIRAARAGLAVCHLLNDKHPHAPGTPGSGCHLIDDKSPAQIAVLATAPTATYDGVLVDAPCTGSGTWRRAPHLKWTTSAADVAKAAERQAALLADLSARVRPGGGRLIYATCSLSHMENEDVVAAFLATHVDFTADGPARTILPAAHNTDGVFVAALRRK